jgi:hypothetical protein
MPMKGMSLPEVLMKIQTLSRATKKKKQQKPDLKELALESGLQ